MSKKQKATTQDDDRLDAFAQQVEQVLEHFADPQWLGANSRLAAPFILGQVTFQGNQIETATSRGIALQNAVRKATEQLDDELRLFITDLYLERNQRFTNVARAMKHSMSERTFYRRRQQAVQTLAAILYDALVPPLRAEQLPLRPMVGRTQITTDCLVALTAGEAVHLTGISGVGKTAVAAHIAKHWPFGTFWFTVRAGLTDRLASFVFAIAFYLRSRGASATWRQLVAGNGLIQIDHVLSLLRYDLSMFQEDPLLFCIDDVDVLTVERADHSQLIYLLDALRSHARLLLIGQRITLETDVHFAVMDFDTFEFEQWLDYADIGQVESEQRTKLYQATNGHPAILTLLLTLHRYGEDFLATAASLSNIPSLELILTRVWRRLSERERQVLTEIAIFRTQAPRNAWLSRADVVDRLLTTGLVSTDGHGGVECDQHIRPLINERIPEELRRALHLRAAMVLEEHGEFVRAIHHYIEGRQPAQAIWLWFRHRVQQIERGQGPAALELLDQITVAELVDPADQDALRISRAELLKLVGRSEEVGDALTGLHLRRTGVTSAYSQQLLADALEIQGDIERSLASYRSALETLMGSIPLRQVVIYQRLSFLHITRLPDLTAAEQESLQALFHAETFAANVDELRGDLTSARARYERALEIAKHVRSNVGLLTIGYSHLGKLLLKAGELESAVQVIQLALSLAEQRGDVMGPLYDRINLSYTLAVQGRHADALVMATDGLTVAERMRHAYLIAGLSAAAADAACRARDLETAELYAMRSIIQEEEFFRPWALTVLGLVQAGTERIPASIKSLQMAVEGARSQEDVYGEAYALEALGQVRRMAGDLKAAETSVRRALKLYLENGFIFEASRLRNEMTALGLRLDLAGTGAA